MFYPEFIPSAAATQPTNDMVGPGGFRCDTPDPRSYHDPNAISMKQGNRMGGIMPAHLTAGLDGTVVPHANWAGVSMGDAIANTALPRIALDMFRDLDGNHQTTSFPVSEVAVPEHVRDWARAEAKKLYPIDTNVEVQRERCSYYFSLLGRWSQENGFNKKASGTANIMRMPEPEPAPTPQSYPQQPQQTMQPQQATQPQQAMQPQPQVASYSGIPRARGIPVPPQQPQQPQQPEQVPAPSREMVIEFNGESMRAWYHDVVFTPEVLAKLDASGKVITAGRMATVVLIRDNRSKWGAAWFPGLRDDAFEVAEVNTMVAWQVQSIGLQFVFAHWTQCVLFVTEVIDLPGPVL